MGSYNSDSHNVQRYVTEEGFVQNEGNMEVPVQPYQIPYRILTPKKDQAGEFTCDRLFLSQSCDLFNLADGTSLYDHRSGSRYRSKPGDC